MFKTLIAAAVAAITASTVAAQSTNCGTFEEAVALLNGKYEETIVFAGIVSNQKGVLQIWMNPETGSWTLLVTDANRASCLVAAGGDAELVE